MKKTVKFSRRNLEGTLFLLCVSLACTGCAGKTSETSLYTPSSRSEPITSTTLSSSAAPASSNFGSLVTNTVGNLAVPSPSKIQSFPAPALPSGNSTQDQIFQLATVAMMANIPVALVALHEHCGNAEAAAAPVNKIFSTATQQLTSQNSNIQPSPIRPLTNAMPRSTQVAASSNTPPSPSLLTFDLR